MERGTRASDAVVELFQVGVDAVQLGWDGAAAGCTIPDVDRLVKLAEAKVVADRDPAGTELELFSDVVVVRAGSGFVLR
jgi:hypothetical protein